ncbi:hypothetical protein GQ600_16464 [Phytophthora cactorum]|nr:hypothetical protein GQ600_16464 [Phytophthora cactorum]
MPSYDDILDAIHGLSTLGQDVWYKSADPETTPVALHWRTCRMMTRTGFCESLRAIDYQSPAWTMALVSVLTQERTFNAKRVDTASASKSATLPSLVPFGVCSRSIRGQEPCLLNVAWLSCSGGSRDRCGNSKRTQIGLTSSCQSGSTALWYASHEGRPPLMMVP